MKTLLLLGFALTVTACGGGSFEGFKEPTDPEAGAAGDVAGGAGGEGATGTGGTASQGGTAGTLAGTGGEPGGAPGTGGGGAGAAGSAGTATGGTGGATAPSCAPEDAIVFPESFTWNGFSTRWDDVDQSYCGHSDGGSCSFRNLTLNYTDPTHLNIYANLDCAFTGTVAGVCGSETPCDSTIDSRTGAGASFVVVPDGDGYRLTDTGMSGFGTFVEGESCRTELAPGRFWSPGGDPTVDFRTDFMAFMAAQRFACP